MHTQALQHAWKVRTYISTRGFLHPKKHRGDSCSAEDGMKWRVAGRCECRGRKKRQKSVLFSKLHNWCSLPSLLSPLPPSSRFVHARQQTTCPLPHCRAVWKHSLFRCTPVVVWSEDEMVYLEIATLFNSTTYSNKLRHVTIALLHFEKVIFGKKKTSSVQRTIKKITMWFGRHLCLLSLLSRKVLKTFLLKNQKNCHLTLLQSFLLNFPMWLLCRCFDQLAVPAAPCCVGFCSACVVRPLLFQWQW